MALTKTVRHAGAGCGASRWLSWAVCLMVVGLSGRLSAQPGAGPTGSSVSPATKRPTTVTDSCLTAACHTDLLDHKVVHRPVSQDKCLACHTYQRPATHQFGLVRPDNRLCTDCHKLALRNVVHQPLARDACTACHDPHGSAWKKMLLDDPTGPLCRRCHDPSRFNTKKYKHAPVATGACILCHEAHSSWQPKLLVRSQPQLCQTCHRQVLPPDDPSGRHVHPPARQDCATCHDPHASDYPSQLKQPTSQLCSTCHVQLQQEIERARIVHGPLGQPDGCSTCHAPHSAFLPKLLRQSTDRICLSCHDKPLTTADGRVLTNMAGLLADNPNHHGPIREGQCTACHQPHASDLDNLLVQAYPPQFYAPYSDQRYALCFSCHIPQLVQDKQGLGVTRFRNGPVNLHWLHVNRQKGRTCRACHEVHASRHPFHIRDSVPYGSSGWMLEIKYRKTPQGGQCSPGCHQSRTYDRQARPDEPAGQAGDLPADRSPGESP